MNWTVLLPDQAPTSNRPFILINLSPISATVSLSACVLNTDGACSKLGPFHFHSGNAYEDENMAVEAARILQLKFGAEIYVQRQRCI